MTAGAGGGVAALAQVPRRVTRRGATGIGGNAAEPARSGGRSRQRPGDSGPTRPAMARVLDVTHRGRDGAGRSGVSDPALKASGRRRKRWRRRGTSTGS